MYCTINDLIKTFICSLFYAHQSVYETLNEITLYCRNLTYKYIVNIKFEFGCAEDFKQSRSFNSFLKEIKHVCEKNYQKINSIQKIEKSEIE